MPLYSRDYVLLLEETKVHLDCRGVCDKDVEAIVSKINESEKIQEL